MPEDPDKQFELLVQKFLVYVSAYSSSFISACFKSFAENDQVVLI